VIYGGSEMPVLIHRGVNESIALLVSGLGLLLPPGLGWLSVANAQTIPDRSLGVESSIVTTTGPQDLISGGAVRGSNLFHSFQDLNVGVGRSLFFANPMGISRIFGRITGNQPSQIFGTLGVLGNADLILINPHGITFGPESRLALGGSFLGTTAERITFADGATFGALNPESNALLTIATPTGLQVGTMPGAIVNQSRADGVGLTIAPLQTLALVGGDITLDGGRISTESGRIELVSARNSPVGISPNGSGFRLTSLPTSGGTIQWINQSNITLQTTIENPDAQIHLVADRLNLQDQSIVQTINGSMVQGAGIDLQANRLEMSGGASFLSLINGVGAGGDIRVRVAGDSAIDGDNPVTPSNISGFYSRNLGIGRSGDLILETDRLLLTRGGAIFSDTYGAGQGGTIDITAQSIEAKSIAAYLPYSSLVIGSVSFGPGQGGDIKIAVGNLTMQNGAAIQSAAIFDGPGGNITITATDTLRFSGANPNPIISLFPSGVLLPTYGTGKGGSLDLTTTHLIVEDGANILTAVLPRDIIFRLSGRPELVGLPNAGLGNAGDIRVQAETVVVRGVNARFSSAPTQLSSLTFVTGNAGDVTVSTRDLRVEGGAVLASSSVLALTFFLPSGNLPFPLVQGNGGNLTIEAQSIGVDGVNPVSGLGSILGTQTAGSGQSGTTIINTDTLRVSNGGRLSASSNSFGNAGTLEVTARDRIEVTGVNANGQSSTLGTDVSPASDQVRKVFQLPSLPTGNSGSLQITTPQLSILDGGTVGVQNAGTGDAGQLMVTADRLFLDHGKLTAATFSGRGGDIDLQIRDVILLRRGSQITAEAFGYSGNGGNLKINAGFIVAPTFENSDIIANAFGGQGGTISLRTGALLGLQYRDRLTPSSDISDISASSKFGLNGLVKIDDQGFNSHRDLFELPTNLLDESRQIVASCDRQSTSSFVLTGRGGLPSDPRDPNSDLDILQDWRSGIAGDDLSRKLTRSGQVPLDLVQSRRPPIEAQVVQRSLGRIELIATAHPETPIGIPTCITAQPPSRSSESSSQGTTIQ
jgi:filamentous hemagglutinin family protein